MGVYTVRTDTYNYVTHASQNIHVVPKITSLLGTTGSVVLGVEVEDNLLSFKLFKAKLPFPSLLVYSF